MGINANYAVTPRIGFASVSTANTNRDGTGTVPTVLTAGSNGTRIERIVIHSTGNPADSVITLFIHDGSAFWLWNEVDLGDPAAGSTTVSAFHFEMATPDLVLPASHSIRAAITVALTAGVANVMVFGADL